MDDYKASKVKRRLSEFLKFIGSNNNQFVIKMGYASTFLNSKGGISEEKLGEISKAYPELDMNWLFSGAGEMVRQDVKQSGWGNINTSSGNASVEKIVQNDHSVNIALPEKGFQKIINSDGSETTIEAHSFDMDKIAQIEAENKKLREKLEHLDSVLHENSVLKDRIMELQTRLITLLSPKTND